MYAAADEFHGDLGEPAFDQVEPGRSGRGEVQVEPGVARSQRWIAGVLWVDRLSHDQVHVVAGRDVLVDLDEELGNSMARCWGCMGDDLAGGGPATSSAANRSAVPARM